MLRVSMHTLDILTNCILFKFPLLSLVGAFLKWNIWCANVKLKKVPVNTWNFASNQSCSMQLALTFSNGGSEIQLLRQKLGMMCT